MGMMQGQAMNNLPRRYIWPSDREEIRKTGHGTALVTARAPDCIPVLRGRDASATNEWIVECPGFEPVAEDDNVTGNVRA